MLILLLNHVSSLPDRLGPRWEYLQQLRLHGVVAFTDAHEVIGSLVAMTDSKFAAKYRAPQVCSCYEQFKKQCQNR